MEVSEQRKYILQAIFDCAATPEKADLAGILFQIQKRFGLDVRYKFNGSKLEKHLTQMQKEGLIQSIPFVTMVDGLKTTQGKTWVVKK